MRGMVIDLCWALGESAVSELVLVSGWHHLRARFYPATTVVALCNSRNPGCSFVRRALGDPGAVQMSSCGSWLL